ncbi:hypothetical protein [Lactococcus lactis]|uniref:hypothetical protein n=1 Tax=Lactococcus lactis TaxID=1358 RepID=UPI00207D442C|nr:hypothetical protein [Lactococcus lactis]
MIVWDAMSAIQNILVKRVDFATLTVGKLGHVGDQPMTLIMTHLTFKGAAR